MEAKKFDDDQRTELKEAFSLFNKSGDGTITPEELGAVMTSLGQDPSPSELKELIAEVDSDDKGCIDFNEFLVMMGKKINDPNTKSILKEAFAVYDQDADGKISANDLRPLMNILGEQLTQEEVDEMVKEAEGDGAMDYMEFIEQIMA